MEIFMNKQGTRIAIKEEGGGFFAAIVRGKGKRRTFQTFACSPDRQRILDTLGLTDNDLLRMEEANA